MAFILLPIEFVTVLHVEEMLAEIIKPSYYTVITQLNHILSYGTKL